MSAKLIYTAICSLDGFIADDDGNFDWAEPKEDVHRYINELEARNDAALYGRKLYEIMLAWEDLDLEGVPEFVKDYALGWRATEKIVYSRTLAAVKSAHTTLRTSFDPEEVRALKNRYASLGIGGAELAGVAFRHGLVDEVNLFLHPEIRGSGNPALARGVRAGLTLVDTKAFASGVVLLHYTRR